jgi:hypothetical protein
MSLRELALGSHSALPTKTLLSFTAPNPEEAGAAFRIVLTGRNLAKVTVEEVTFNGGSLLPKKGSIPAMVFEASAKNNWIAIDKKTPLPAKGVFEIKILNQGDPVADLRDTTDLRVRIFTLGVDEVPPPLDAPEAM